MVLKICNLWCRSNRYGAKKYFKTIQIFNTLFVDDDKNKIGRTIDGIRVFSPKSLEEEAKSDLVLICMPSASSFEVKNIKKYIKIIFK